VLVTECNPDFLHHDKIKPLPALAVVDNPRNTSCFTSNLISSIAIDKMRPTIKLKVVGSLIDEPVNISTQCVSESSPSNVLGHLK
jgi:hypothetical protein